MYLVTWTGKHKHQRVVRRYPFFWMARIAFGVMVVRSGTGFCWIRGPGGKLLLGAAIADH